MANMARSDETMRITIPSGAIDAETSPTDVKIKEHAPPNAVRSKLSENEYALYTQFMDSIYDAVIIADWTGNILDGNVRSAEFFHCRGGDLCALTIFDIFYGFNPDMLERVRRSVDTDKRFVLIEGHCCRLDGSMFSAEIASNKLELGGDRLVCFFVRDTTKRKEHEAALRKAQERLAQSERLEAAGRVAGSIAHDFNNLLTPLLGYPGLIKKELPEDSPAAKDLDIIADTAQRIADINQQLLMISRRSHYKHQPVDLNAVIKNLVDLVSRERQDDIELKLDLADNLFSVIGAEEQLLRVVQNLYHNAIDAMGENGTLTIRTENIYIEERVNDKDRIKPGEYVKLSVTDTGCGIRPEIKDKIFEPFFSTHRKGTKRRGAGLGMSVVYGVIQDHNGHIELESEVGRGTTFNVLLPAERRSFDMKENPDIMALKPDTILVVDDDQIQINVLTKMLEMLGYKVVAAESGEEAVSIVEKSMASEDPPSLAVIDMVMGSGMDGAETYLKLKEINPGQKAVFISGRAESNRVKIAQSKGGGTFLAKPASAVKLGAAIRAELDKPGLTR